jgi:serine/threonine-protein kinase
MVGGFKRSITIFYKVFDFKRYKMKKIVIILFVAGFILGCKGEKEHNLWAPPEPAIVGIQPDRGSEETVVTISGRRFSGTVSENTVKINGVDAVVIEAADNLLKVIVPKDAGTGEITVTVNGHTSKGPVFNYMERTYEYVVSTFAGSTSGFVNGVGTAAKFTNPGGIAVDNFGNIIVCDRTNHSIRKITPAGVVTTLAGNGTAAFADGSPGQFKFPWQCALDGQGNIIVADKDNDRIRKVTPSGVVSTIAGSGIRGFADGTPGNFTNPLGVAVDEAGNVYVADRENNRVRKVSTAGVVSTFAGDGTTAILNKPVALAIDKDGNLFVADFANYKIKKITPTGVISTIAGTGVKGYTDGTPGKPLTAQLGDVFGLTIDKKGNIIFADASNARIRMITPTADGSYDAANITTIAGTGTVGKIDGVGTIATFNNPYDVAVDAQGGIYVAEASNHLIRKITYK